jgi:pimeloyl-ACP methyl ester carboxylesterase
MEPVTFSHAGGPRLAGLYHGADTRNGVVLAHGFCNDKASNGRFDALSRALSEAGLAVLAFDFAGCGESADAVLTPESLRADLDAAITFMTDAGHDRLGLFGNSLGGSLCLRVRHPAVVAVAATGAATAPMQYDWSDHFSARQLAELEETGHLTETVESPWRDHVIVSASLLQAFGEGSMEERVGGLSCPVLLIYGGDPGDDEERLLAEATARAMALLPKGSRRLIVEGAGHGLRDQWDTVTEEVAAWFRQMAPA